MSTSISFLKHNNAVPIFIFAVFGMATATFAANPDVRNAMYESRQEVRQVDNTYIVAADIGNRDFRMQVTDVKEDADTFYVTYAYKDITIVDHVWKEAETTGSMTVSKKELEGRDLGLYVAKQLGEVVNAKRAYLADVQKHERRAGATSKVVATTYSGMIGKFLDPDEERFPGYVAVIEPAKSNYNNPVPADAGAPQQPEGNISVSLPNPNASQPQLTQAQIEQMVAEQVRAILAGAAASTASTASSPEPAAPADPVPTPAEPATTATTTPTPTEPAGEPSPEPAAEPTTEPAVPLDNAFSTASSTGE
jgi:hypothetical protein